MNRTGFFVAGAVLLGGLVAQPEQDFQQRGDVAGRGNDPQGFGRLQAVVKRP